MKSTMKRIFFAVGIGGVVACTGVGLWFIYQAGGVPFLFALTCLFLVLALYAYDDREQKQFSDWYTEHEDDPDLDFESARQGWYAGRRYQ